MVLWNKVLKSCYCIFAIFFLWGRIWPFDFTKAKTNTQTKRNNPSWNVYLFHIKLFYVLLHCPCSNPWLVFYTYVALIHWVKITCPLGTRPLWRCRSYSPCSCSLICILPYPNQLLQQKGIFFYFLLINVYIKWVILPSVLSDIWYRDDTIWSSIDLLILCCCGTLEIIFTNIEKSLLRNLAKGLEILIDIYFISGIGEMNLKDYPILYPR